MSSNEFEGIWDKNNKPEAVTETATTLGTNMGPAGYENVVKKPKKWGITQVFYTFLAFLAAQAVLAVFLIISALTQETLINSTNDLITPTFLLISALTQYLVWVGGMWLTTKFKGNNSFKIDFKVWFKKWDVFIGLGVAIGLFGAVMLLNWFLSDVLKIDLTGANNGATFSVLEGVWFFVLAIGIATILGPIAEELFFRGFMLNSIIETIKNKKNKNELLGKTNTKFTNFFVKHSTATAVIVSSIVFGFMHFQGDPTSFGHWFVVAVTGILGLVFALVSVKMGRIGPAIFAHIFYNGTSMVLSQFI